MIVIGDRINGSLENVRRAIGSRDAGAIARLAAKQAEAGAAYMDINAGMFGEREAEQLEWLAACAQSGAPLPLSLDSPHPAALRRALAANRNGKPIVNSITGEKKRFDGVLPLVREYGASVIALCMDGASAPRDAGGRVEAAERILEKLVGAGVALADIYIDPLIMPIAAGARHAEAALETVRGIRLLHPDIRITCGLSNISHGLPARRLVNRVFLAAAMAAGLDSAIMDPLDGELMASACAAEAMLGRGAGREALEAFVGRYGGGGSE
ncbi:MAG: dihydropteroate synthase [Clostridiales bacterium]|jgi:5-methyltetrahydrofolate--homocysteine methyltransferase|nr:dihydropteroate synthase [Clostridiales bacterium]